LFVPETSGAARSARFFFSALGLQAIGFSPFGLDYTRSQSAPSADSDARNAFLEPTAQNYRLVGPMMRDVARLNFEGKLQAAAEVEGKPAQTLHFGNWDAVVSYGLVAGAAPPKGIPSPWDAL
jgi:hypothetical protein